MIDGDVPFYLKFWVKLSNDWYRPGWPWMA